MQLVISKTLLCNEVAIGSRIMLLNVKISNWQCTNCTTLSAQTDEAKVTTEKNGDSTSATPAATASPTKTESKTEPSTKGKRYLYGSNSIGCPREGMEMTTMMKDGMIEDWDLFENRFEIGPVIDHLSLVSSLEYVQ